MSIRRKLARSYIRYRPNVNRVTPPVAGGNPQRGEVKYNAK
jgi:hypothetical protein